MASLLKPMQRGICVAKQLPILTNSMRLLSSKPENPKSDKVETQNVPYVTKKTSCNKFYKYS